MDASSKIQGSIHDVRLTYKYVSRILGTYQTRAVICMSWNHVFHACNQDCKKSHTVQVLQLGH